MWLTRYDASGPSSRYRVYQYLGGLETDGWCSSVEPLSPSPPAGTSALAGIARRVVRTNSIAWRRSSTLDALVIQKEVVLPDFLLRTVPLRRLTQRQFTVWDIDDAIWAIDAGREALARSLATHVHTVVAGNEVLAEWARSAGARRVVVVPTCLVVPRGRPAPRDPKRPTIAWIGSASTEKYLGECADGVLAAMDELPSLHFDLVGGRAPTQLAGHPRLRTFGWTPDTERLVLARAHAGLAPLPRGQWEDGKCAFKIVQYLANGVIPVASAGPVHDAVLAGTGYTASHDWAELILRAIAGPDRELLAIAAWERAKSSFDVSVGRAAWNRLLDEGVRDYDK